MLFHVACVTVIVSITLNYTYIKKITKQDMHKLSKLGHSSCMLDAREKSHEYENSTTQCFARVHSSQPGNGEKEEPTYDSVEE